MKKKTRKTAKICLVCGEEFLGTAAAQTCSGACRVTLSRIKAAKKRPEFLLMAKGKGQKIPDLNAPKRLKFKKGEKKSAPEMLESKVNYAPADEKSFDGKELMNYTLDEIGKTEPAKPMTKEQKDRMIFDLEKRIDEVKARRHKPSDGHPRVFAMQKESDISNLQEQINLLK